MSHPTLKDGPLKYLPFVWLLIVLYLVWCEVTGDFSLINRKTVQTSLIVLFVLGVFSFWFIYRKYGIPNEGKSRLEHIHYLEQLLKAKAYVTQHVLNQPSILIPFLFEGQKVEFLDELTLSAKSQSAVQRYTALRIKIDHHWNLLMKGQAGKTLIGQAFDAIAKPNYQLQDISLKPQLRNYDGIKKIPMMNLFL